MLQESSLFFKNTLCRAESINKKKTSINLYVCKIPKMLKILNEFLEIIQVPQVIDKCW